MAENYFGQAVMARLANGIPMPCALAPTRPAPSVGTRTPTLLKTGGALPPGVPRGRPGDPPLPTAKIVAAQDLRHDGLQRQTAKAL
jgi:hypothetical protein